MDPEGIPEVVYHETASVNARTSQKPENNENTDSNNSDTESLANIDEMIQTAFGDNDSNFNKMQKREFSGK